MHPEIRPVFARSCEVIGTVWFQALLGSVLTLVGTGAGWTMGGGSSAPPVRVVAWWVRKVALPLLRSRSWWRRAATIYLNNMTVLTGLMLLGRWQTMALVAVATLGVTLGIGLRVLAGEPDAFFDVGTSQSSGRARRIRIGMGLNLLEPPAIMLTIGLCLAGSTLAPAHLWECFVLWVIPAMLLAAAGEALWLGQATKGRTDGANANKKATDIPGAP